MWVEHREEEKRGRNSHGENLGPFKVRPGLEQSVIQAGKAYEEDKKQYLDPVEISASCSDGTFVSAHGSLY